MKLPVTRLLAILMLALTTAGCTETNTPEPLLQADEVKSAVIGKWLVERIDYQLCRDRNCTASHYGGHASDYFEFRADSAFLVLTEMPQDQQQQGYKASYHLPGSVVLTRGGWSARFELKQVKASRLVLESAFTGRDPNAIFTDIYYLYRN